MNENTPLGSAERELANHNGNGFVLACIATQTLHNSHVRLSLYRYSSGLLKGAEDVFSGAVQGLVKPGHSFFFLPACSMEESELLPSTVPDLLKSTNPPQTVTIAEA